MAANSAINSAEVMCDQGHWERSLELFDGALRNYRAVNYAPGIAATWLFSAVAEMRMGSLDRAARLLNDARAEFVRLEMELLPDADCRRLELDVLADRATTDECDQLVDAHGADPAIRSRARRCGAIVHARLGHTDHAQSMLLDAIAGPPVSDFERGVDLQTLIELAPDELDDGWQAEVEAIFARLGVVRLPPLVRSEAGR